MSRKSFTVSLDQPHTIFENLYDTIQVSNFSILKVTCLLLLVLLVFRGHSQDTAQKKHLPIIDVHVHALKVNSNFSMDMCPWFLKNMPGGDPNQPAPSSHYVWYRSSGMAKIDQDFNWRD